MWRVSNQNVFFQYEDTIFVCQNNAGINVIGGGEDMHMDLAEAGALSHNNDIIDIYSNSWGPPDTGFWAVGPESITRRALEMGAKEVCDIPHRKYPHLKYF